MEPLQENDLEKTARLFELAHDGDRQAWEDLFRRYAPRVRRMVLKHVGWRPDAVDLIDDLAQDALLRAHRGFDRFEWRTRGQFRAWLHGCALSAIRDQFRRRRPERRFSELSDETLTDSILAGNGPTPSGIVAGRELEERIVEALLALDERYRTIIIRRQLCGQEYGEIRDEMGFREESTVRGVFRKAIQKLRRSLEEID